MSAAFLDGDPEDPTSGTGRGPKGPPAEGRRRVGSLDEEMALLASALEATRGTTTDDERPRGAVPREPPCPTCGNLPGGPTSPSTCTWCPVCRGVGLVRTLGPETLRSLADVASLLSEGLRRAATWIAEEAPPPPRAPGAQGRRPTAGPRGATPDDPADGDGVAGPAGDDPGPAGLGPQGRPEPGETAWP